MEYDRELIRLQLLEIVDHASTSYGVHLHQIHTMIYEKYKGSESPELREIVFEELFVMVSEGMIRPETRANNREGTIRWQYFEPTNYGREVLRYKGAHPYFVKAYLNRIVESTPAGGKVDIVVEFYVRESAELARIGKYTSSVVMLGVASERIVDLLCDAVLGVLQQKAKSDFAKVMDNQSIKKKVDKVADIVQSTCTDKILLDGFDHIFKGFVTLLRKARNDYGHPNVIQATKGEATAYLATFPEYLKRLNKIIKYYEESVQIGS